MQSVFLTIVIHNRKNTEDESTVVHDVTGNSTDETHLKRSLTIKQMAVVAGVTLVTIAIFISIQLVYRLINARKIIKISLFNAAVSIHNSR